MKEFKNELDNIEKANQIIKLIEEDVKKASSIIYISATSKHYGLITALESFNGIIKEFELHKDYLKSYIKQNVTNCEIIKKPLSHIDKIIDGFILATLNIRIESNRAGIPVETNQNLTKDVEKITKNIKDLINDLKEIYGIIPFILKEREDNGNRHYYTKDEEFKIIERTDFRFLLYKLNHKEDCYDWTETYHNSLEECESEARKILSQS